MLEERDKLIEQLKQNLQKSQQYMKHFADKKRQHEEFQEGDWVLVKLQPYRQLGLGKAPENKNEVLWSFSNQPQVEFCSL